MKAKTFLIIAILLGAILPQVASAQSISRKMKITDEMFEQMGFRFKKTKGKIRFNADNTFEAKMSGRKDLAVRWTTQNASVKVRGEYTIVNDSIFLTVKPEGIKCQVETDRDNPDFSEENEKIFENSNQRSRGATITTTPLEQVNLASASYRHEIGQCSYQEMAMREKMLEVWNHVLPLASLNGSQISLPIQRN